MFTVTGSFLVQLAGVYDSEDDVVVEFKTGLSSNKGSTVCGGSSFAELFSSFKLHRQISRVVVDLELLKKSLQQHRSLNSGLNPELKPAPSVFI